MDNSQSIISDRTQSHLPNCCLTWCRCFHRSIPDKGRCLHRKRCFVPRWFRRSGHRCVLQHSHHRAIQQCFSVALSHCFFTSDFQDTATKNASDIVLPDPTLNKSAYFWENKKAVNTCNYVSTAFFAAFSYFKNTHFFVVEAMRDHLFLRIFKISEVRHHADAWFFAIKIFKKLLQMNSSYSTVAHFYIVHHLRDVKQQSIFQTRLKNLF